MNARLAKLIPHYLVYSKALVVDRAHLSPRGSDNPRALKLRRFADATIGLGLCLISPSGRYCVAQRCSEREWKRVAIWHLFNFAPPCRSKVQLRAS
jgi:hypothetical protein